MNAFGAECAAFIKRFDHADRVLVFDQGRLDVIMLGGHAVGKGSYAPGWRWSRLAPSGLPRGLPDLIGVVLSGRAKIRLTVAGDVDLTPGDFFHITTEEDMWVVGYRPCEILYCSGVEALIQQLQ